MRLLEILTMFRNSPILPTIKPLKVLKTIRQRCNNDIDKNILNSHVKLKIPEYILR